jgi:phosphoesterase RecJ-like protein
VAAVLKQQPEGGYKVSLRSKGATDVGRLATRFDGGGHKYAAGYSTDLDAEAAVAALVAELTGPEGPGGSDLDPRSDPRSLVR